jgi:acetolactate synthase-1/2/3 large subunit
MKARRVSEREGLEPALRELLESETSYFLEVVVEMEENVFPMIPSGSSVSDIRLK